jgi:ATP-dependent DNA helicase RecG
LDRDQLDQLLNDLRTFGTDHQTLEAKRAERELPSTIWETLSAFANGDGGFILFGVDEVSGFAVTGVADVPRVLSAFQAICAEMEPPLRPQIDVIAHEPNPVIAATIAPLPRAARPCFRRARGVYEGAFIRVGDADQHLARAEVDDMLSGRSGADNSRRPTPEGARLDEGAVAVFVAAVRAGSENVSEVDDDALLHAWGATLDSQPTIAGLLALGESPESIVAAARIAYRRLPRRGSPEETRFSGRHFEGRVGDVLEGALRQLERDLEPLQVVRNGDVYDELDVPREALREIIANALLHRSLTPARDGESVSIEVSDDAIVVTSPGGLHPGAEPALLGLDVISSVRNLALVRICERLQTPSGSRIVENQASGIAAADRACHRAGTMPPLFVDLPSRFQVYLLRHPLDADADRVRLKAAGVEPRADYIRVVAVAERLEDVRLEAGASPLRWTVLDARLAARALAPSTVEDAAATVRALEDAWVLERRHLRHIPTWNLTAQPAGAPEPVAGTPTRKRDRVPDLLAAIADSAAGELSPKEIGRALGITSPTSINRWITRAADADLIEPTRENQFDPMKAYRLTASGHARAKGLGGGRRSEG